MPLAWGGGVHREDDITVSPLTIDLGTWAPSIDKEDWDPKDTETTGHKLMAGKMGILAVTIGNQ